MNWRTLRSWCEEHNGHFSRDDGTIADGTYKREYKCKLSESVHHGDFDVGPTHIELVNVGEEEYAQVAIDNSDVDVHHDLDLASDRLELGEGTVTIHENHNRDFGVDEPTTYKI